MTEKWKKNGTWIQILSQKFDAHSPTVFSNLVYLFVFSKCKSPSLSSTKSDKSQNLTGWSTTVRSTTPQNSVQINNFFRYPGVTDSNKQAINQKQRLLWGTAIPAGPIALDLQSTYLQSYLPTADFPIFCARIIVIFWTTCIGREVCSLAVMGNRSCGYCSASEYRRCFWLIACLLVCQCHQNILIHWSVHRKSYWKIGPEQNNTGRAARRKSGMDNKSYWKKVFHLFLNDIQPENRSDLSDMPLDE